MSTSQRLSLMSGQILESNATAIKSRLSSEWNFDRSLSKLDVEEAKRLFCASKYEEEYKILEIVKEMPIFE